MMYSTACSVCLRRILAVWLLCSPVVFAEELVFIGHAYDLKSEQLLYVETHRVQLDAEQQYRKAEVSYQDGEGKLIAFKKLDYSPFVLRPHLEFKDKRERYSLSVNNAENSIVLRTTEQESMELSDVEVQSDDLVIVDAGFDRMVKRYWDRLLAGEQIEFEFLALSRSSLVSFKVYQTAKSKQYVDLAIAPTNWLINLLMEPIALRYERSSGRLMEYRGVTNIRAWEGGRLSEDNYHALIRYEYLPSKLPEDAIMVQREDPAEQAL